MVEDYLRIVPAAVADVVVDDPVGCGKFVQRQGEAADEYDRYANAVGQPAEAAGQADKEVGLCQKVDTFLQGQLAGKVFRPVGDDVEAAVHAVDVFAVDAQYPVAFGLQVFDDAEPAAAVVPVFGLAAGLGGDADVGFLDPALFVLEQQLYAELGRFAAFVQSQDHGRVLVQAPDAEV